jgi:hypothetical protein
MAAGPLSISPLSCHEDGGCGAASVPQSAPWQRQVLNKPSKQLADGKVLIIIETNLNSEADLSDA